MNGASAWSTAVSGQPSQPIAPSDQTTAMPTTASDASAAQAAEQHEQHRADQRRDHGHEPERIRFEIAARDHEPQDRPPARRERRSQAARLA
jgi:hypothetical protein